MTGMYKGYINSIVPDIREKTSSFNEEKTWLDLHAGTEFVQLEDRP
jgi:hypothetical protein